MRIFFLTGLMAATMLTPAAASAAQIAPNLNITANPIQVDLTGTVEAQRDRRSERRANRGDGQRRAQRAQNHDTREQTRLETHGDRAEARQNRRVDHTDRRVDRNVSRDRTRRVDQQTVRPNRDASRATTQNRRVVQQRNVSRTATQNRRVAQHRDVRRGDRNRNVRVDRRYDRNNNVRVERRADRNRHSRIDRSREQRTNHRYRDRRDHARSTRNWNHSWRNDRRYNWQGYRNAHRNSYRLGRYYSPYRHHNYRRWNIGVYLGSAFFGSRYWINDPWRYRLPAAYSGTRWIRYYDDVLLVDTYSGEVIDVIYNFFW